MKIICAFDSFKGCMTAKEDAVAHGCKKEAGFTSIRSINEQDNRSLSVIMQKDIAMANMKETARNIVFI